LLGVIDGHQALEDVLGFARLEGAEPSPEPLQLMQRWAEGELSTERLGAR
jgi:hypothetical protein